MFELFFGIIWTLFTSIVTYFLYFHTGGTRYVNGVEVSQSEIQNMPFPMIFIGSFFIVGLLFIIIGLKKVYKDYQTKKNGEECYGRIVSIQPTGKSVNDKPIYKAEILIYSENEGKEYTISEEIGYNPEKYPVGNFLRVLYYNGDINIIKDSITEKDIPENMKDYLYSKSPAIAPNEDKEFIMIDGIKYIRQDLIDKYKNI